MTVNLSGVRFDQIYGDGTASQEDKFVSFTNTNGTSIDISGWQIWRDASGTNAIDSANNGLYHTFPSGTSIGAGKTLCVVNEISGTQPEWAQEASEGDQTSTDSKFIVLVNPDTGDYIVFNMAGVSNIVPNQTDFPGTTKVGEVVQNAAVSFRFNSNTDQYENNAAFLPCLVAGTKIGTINGNRCIETLEVGDLVQTHDNGFQPVQWIGKSIIDLTDPKNAQHRPIYLGELGVSPQNRILLADGTLAPAKGLTHLAFIEPDKQAQIVNYFHLLLPRHEIIFANEKPAESLHLGSAFLNSAKISDRIKLANLNLPPSPPIRRCRTVKQARNLSHAQGQLHGAPKRSTAAQHAFSGMATGSASIGRRAG